MASSRELFVALPKLKLVATQNWYGDLNITYRTLSGIRHSTVHNNGVLDPTSSLATEAAKAIEAMSLVSVISR